MKQTLELPDIKTATNTGYPYISTPVYHTAAGNSYLRAPGVAIVAGPLTDFGGLRDFLNGFDPELGFEQYLDDPDTLADGTQLVKTAGQACYASFGPKRTTNAAADDYIQKLLSSGHGSVLEHANYTLFIHGVSRSLSHELVRHRAGLGYSQLSQRYVSGKVLRFVERPEYVNDEILHQGFIDWIDASAREYSQRTQRLIDIQGAGSSIMSGEQKTDQRKKVQGAARSALPNETETFLAVTGNVRAWRHTINMRANAHAETEIRLLFVAIYRVLSYMEPLLFGDMELATNTDGLPVVNVEHQKV